VVVGRNLQHASSEYAVVEAQQQPA
jgi:hypothetical protein